MRSSLAAFLATVSFLFSPQAHASFIGGVESYLYSYNGGTFTLLYPPNTFVAAANNDAGQIVGGDEQSGVLGSGGFVRGGTNGINNNGETTGSVILKTGIHRFIERSFGPNGLFGPNNARALEINDAGVIVGSYHNSGFIYDAGVFTTFNYPGAQATWLTGINDAGQIIGDFFVPGTFPNSGQVRAFLYESGSFTTIDVPGATGTFATGLNDLGQIVGYFVQPPAIIVSPDFILFDDRQGFFYVSGAFTTLPKPHSTGRMLPEDINNLGEIVEVIGTPEPSALSIFGIGILVVLGARRALRPVASR